MLWHLALFNHLQMAQPKSNDSVSEKDKGKAQCIDDLATMIATSKKPNNYRKKNPTWCSDWLFSWIKSARKGGDFILSCDRQRKLSTGPNLQGSWGRQPHIMGHGPRSTPEDTPVGIRPKQDCLEPTLEPTTFSLQCPLQDWVGVASAEPHRSLQLPHL